MMKFIGLVFLMFACVGTCLTQNRDVVFQVGFYINGDSTDVRVIDVYIASDGKTASLKEVTLNSWFFVNDEWSTDAGTLKVKKTGKNSFQLHTSDDVGLYQLEQFFTFTMGFWGDLYSVFEITGKNVIVYESGPNKGKIFSNNFIPIRLSEPRSDCVRNLNISLPGIFGGVKKGTF